MTNLTPVVFGIPAVVSLILALVQVHSKAPDVVMSVLVIKTRFVSRVAVIR